MLGVGRKLRVQVLKVLAMRRVLRRWRRALGSAGVVLLALIVCGCGGSGSNGKPAPQSLDGVQKKIRVGMTPPQVQALLKRSLGREGHYYPATHEILFMQRGVSRELLTREDQQLIVEFDDQGLVVEVKVRSVYTGP